MATTVPKRVLIQVILDEFPRDIVLQHFRIGLVRDVSARLNSFSKDKLEDFITRSEDGKNKLENVQKKYPFGKSPTFYLIYINRCPSFEEIIEKTNKFSEIGRDGGKVFGEEKSIRIVYLDQPGYLLPQQKEMIEIPIRYERKFEYNVGDPTADNYGEHVINYSLEQAFIWVMKDVSHGIICCNDYVAINPILNFVSQLSIKSGLPNLTEEMLNQLSENSSVRRATFSSQENGDETSLDVKTLMIADPSLEERDTYQRMKNDDSRYQTSGFYNNHPNLAFGGLGISRRYGRIWTSVHLSRSSLVALSLGLITRTEQELGKEYQRSSSGYIDYFRNIPIVINNYVLKGRERDVFDLLLSSILDANKKSIEIVLHTQILRDLILHQNHLALHPLLNYDCENCGDDNLGICLQCGQPYQAICVDEEILFQCPSCKNTISVDNPYQCECGNEIELLGIENNLQILPETGLLAGIQDFLENLDDVNWNGTFIIYGQNLKLISLQERPQKYIFDLSDFRRWRNLTRYQLREVPNKKRQEYLNTILNKTKEKCKINNYHPKHQDCNACFERIVTEKDIVNGEFCLPRLIGLAIEKEFDGVHHRYEIADIKYQDVLESDSKDVFIGIHLKSRARSKQRVGRGNKRIKALYTQTLFSAYQKVQGKIDFDIIGISIPNIYIEDVLESIKELFKRLGLNLLIVDWNDWIKILEIVLEQVKFQEERRSQH